MRKLKLLAGLGLVSFLFAHGETILFIGDSITDGNWGSPDKYPCSSSERNQWDQNHILGHGYAEMTAGYFMGNYPEKGYRFINRGISGETLNQISQRWNEDALSYKPDVISLLCGTNDVHYWLETQPENRCDFYYANYKNNLDSLIHYTLSSAPETKIVLCTPFVAKASKIGQNENFELRKSVIDSIADIVREVSCNYGENVILVDYNSLLDELLKENPTPEYWMWDGIHPTTAMHYRMSKQWIENFTD